MHPALRLDRLNRLPPSIRRAAQAACSATRSVDDFRRVQRYLETATEEQILFMLPVFYTNLDPAGVPDLDHYDTENPSADAEKCIGRALLSLLCLYVTKFPSSIGPDIWPRVWPWIQFLYIYREHLPNAPSQSEDVFCLDFLMFVGNFANHGESFALILATPGVRFLVAKAWPHVPHIMDPRKRELGFTDLRSFMVNTTIAEPINFAEIVDGAGGTLGHVADLITLYMEAMFPAQGGTIQYAYVVFTSAIVDFVIRIEPAFDDSDSVMGPLGPLGTALVSRRIVPILTRLLCTLGGSTVSLASSTITNCFKVLGSILAANPGKITWLSDALEFQLLRALVICAGGPHAARVQNFLEFFVVVLIPPRLVHPGVLAALAIGLDDADELACADTFRRSRIYNRWKQFSELAEDRITLLDSYKDHESPSMRACDNLQCGQIRVKSTFRRCSGCLSLYYCSKSCQSLDWLEGGHRQACKTYGTLSLRGNNELDLTARDRSFLRALIHHDYQKKLNKATFFSQTAMCMATQPGEDFLILYDYSLGEVKLSIQPLSSAQTNQHLGGPEWTDIVSRAKRSGLRMGLHVVAFNGAYGMQYHVIPLRSNKSSVHDGLQALAAGLPADRETWDDDATPFATRIRDLILTHTEDADLLEVH
ncbi:hypothetical protein DFH06DRAFT_1179929 [Mycena polygramma]|nr:hypothetical protein DFH06DRAFT_1179929 [Mycena polygramma]